jgi:hypothetical protein
VLGASAAIRQPPSPRMPPHRKLRVLEAVAELFISCSPSMLHCTTTGFFAMFDASRIGSLGRVRVRVVSLLTVSGTKSATAYSAGRIVRGRLPLKLIPNYATTFYNWRSVGVN